MAFSVLVVEDDPAWMEALCEMYERLLLDKSAEVLPASTVKTARHFLEKKSIDLLSLDLNVSGTDKMEGDGRTLIREASNGEMSVGGLVVITRFAHDEELDVLMPKEEVPKARMELGLLLHEYFGDRYHHVPKQPDLSVDDNVQIIEEGLSPGSLLTLCNARNVFRKESQGWFVRYDGKIARLNESINFKRIQYLLQHPNKEISSTTLVNAFRKPDPDSLDDLRSDMSIDQLWKEENLREVVDYQGEDSLDEQAIQECIDRLQKIEDKIEIHRSTSNEKEISDLTEEKEMILKELGYSGVGKKIKSSLEKHRKRVEKSIKRAINDILNVHSDLGKHLYDSIKTGKYCHYKPSEAVDWRF